MSKKLKRTIIGIAIAVGALMPLRPFFANPTDPATETIDLIMTPALILGRTLPAMGDLRIGRLLLMLQDSIEPTA